MWSIQTMNYDSEIFICDVYIGTLISNLDELLS